MFKNRMTAMALALVTALTLTGGFALAESADTAVQAETVTGRVTAVSTDSITMELGTLTAGDASSNADASSGATAKPDDSAAPDATAARTPQLRPDATAAPDAGTTSRRTRGKASGAASFTASGESLTFSITDSTTFTLGSRKAKGSLSDISVGTILTFTLSGDTATDVAILRGAAAGSPGRDRSPDGKNRGRKDARDSGDNRKSGRRGGNAPSDKASSGDASGEAAATPAPDAMPSA
jgi:hypothetical protein